MLGTIGNLLLLIAFLGCVFSGAAYFKAARESAAGGWRTLGRVSWGVVVLATVSASALLVYLLFTHQYQYAYVYEHASNDLAWYFLLSAFWEGQEGSFLLWIFYTSLVGLALMAWSSREYEPPVMTVMAFCQFFLLSMIVGLPIGFVEIGASPFQPLAAAFPDAPFLQANPGYVPADGQGLNELLKSYWMAIHPPTLFLGFAAMTVPFAFAVAALWKKKYTQWVRRALPWTLFATLILGVAIAMGGYWAYETLSFGGFWAWDPVENASLVPWLIGIAALHTMLIQKKSGRGHKAALMLSILAYMLVVYESFLTRSGILGEISVHSFVDLGLYNQLLIWMAVIGIGGFALFAYRYQELPTPERESYTLSREFLIFSGALLLCAVAIVVTLGTSAPIFGRFFRDQPSAVPIEFYNTWTLPLAVGIVFLAGLGQLFWWHKMTLERVNRVIIRPLALSIASTAGVLLFTPFTERTVDLAAASNMQSSAAEAGLLSGLASSWAIYGTSFLLMLLVFGAFFALYGNGYVLWRIGRGNPRLAGGALSHIGLALLVLGVVASSALNNPLGGVDREGKARDYFVLRKDKARTVEGYTLRYTGQQSTENGRTAYTLEVDDPGGQSVTLQPVAYKSGGQWFQHPAIKTFFATDLYVAVTPRAMQVDLNSEDKVDGTKKGKGGGLTLARGESTVIGGGAFRIRFVDFDAQVNSKHVPEAAQIAVAAKLEVTNLTTGETRRLRPIYMIMPDRSQQYVQNRAEDWGLAITFAGMNVDSEEAKLIVEGVEITSEDWVVVRASVKPFINVLWLGIILLSAGFLMALVRRVKDLRFHRMRRPSS